MGHRATQAKRLVLKARWVFPVVGEPIPDGSVTVEGPKIVAVGPSSPGDTSGSQEVRDLGNVAILPGLINAHAHLDFSDLAAPLGEPKIGLTPWLRRVMVYRRQSMGAGPQSVLIGLAESTRCGVTALGDIAQADWPIEAAAAAPLNLTKFQELIAPTAQRVPAALELANAHLRRSGAAISSPSSSKDWAQRETASHCNGGERVSDRGLTSGIHPGLSPHAPYTVHPDLLSAVTALSCVERVPVAMHLAESREELELLRYGTGPLRAFLEELGAWDAALFRPETRPLEYLRRLASAHRALVIHGNYLDAEEIGFLAAHAERMAAVYCPRSHEGFGHSPYPLEKMLAAGAVVALGTDGRGSSPDLSVWAEMCAVARRHPTVPLNRVLEMGTILGARALGWEQGIGSLAPGKQADLAIVALADRDAARPHELLFESGGPVVACYYRGVEVYSQATARSPL
jgi:cytosine/adenosine deaminase-related metal-dependent hydrolase